MSLNSVREGKLKGSSKRILNDHVSQGEKSAFNRNMVEETGNSLATVVGWLNFMLIEISIN